MPIFDIGIWSSDWLVPYTLSIKKKKIERGVWEVSDALNLVVNWYL